MLTLLSTLIGFLSSGLPKVIDFFQDKSDKRHELELARMQTERELNLAEIGYQAQQKVEEIKLEQTQVEGFYAERQSLYQHDIEIGKGAAQWVTNMRAMVRPTITFGLFALLVIVDIAGIAYAWAHGADFKVMMDTVWDDETQAIWASIISFWFGSQAFGKK
jgi:hypothetical protein